MYLDRKPEGSAEQKNVKTKNANKHTHMKHGFIKPTGQHMELLNKVFSYYGTDYETMMQANFSRDKAIIKIRGLAMFVLKDRTKLQLKVIAGFFDKDHATARHAIINVQEEQRLYKGARVEIDDLNEMIDGYPTNRTPEHFIKLYTGFVQHPDSKPNAYTWADVIELMQIYGNSRRPKDRLMHFCEYLKDAFNIEIAEHEVDNYIKEVK